MQPFLSPSALRGTIACRSYTSISSFRNQVSAILNGNNSRLVIVVGPCSIHDYEGALAYGHRFKELSQKVKEQCLLVMRVFCEKPRTQHGWRGLIFDPNLDNSYDVAKGLRLTRQLMNSLCEFQIPVATEFVDPLIAPYLQDLITWGFIGARTSASPPHRHLASSCPFPVGFKNSLDGNIEYAIHALLVAKQSHIFLGINDKGKASLMKSSGNPDVHLVLRGSIEAPNYTPEYVANAALKLEQSNLSSRLMIDCAHGNCQKQYQKQIDVFREVINTYPKTRVFGLMLESHLEAGAQTIPPYLPDRSVTDPCIDWDMTESLIEEAAGLSSSAT